VGGLLDRRRKGNAARAASVATAQPEEPIINRFEQLLSIEKVILVEGRQK
jgi:hypothetical protein